MSKTVCYCFRPWVLLAFCDSSGKSLHLAELAAASGGFAVPNSATVPYGALLGV